MKNRLIIIIINDSYLINTRKKLRIFFGSKPEDPPLEIMIILFVASPLIKGKLKLIDHRIFFILKRLDLNLTT